MARIKRIYYARAVYHVVFRGNNRQMILQDKIDKEAFLATLAKYRKRLGFKLYGFVVMDNHVHLVIESGQRSNISKIMQAILLSYSTKFRRKHHYTGHVWQGRFKSNVIEDDRYILDCISYIHNNPVRANLVLSAQEYPWSSFCFYHNLTNALIEDKIELDRFGDTSNKTN